MRIKRLERGLQSVRIAAIKTSNPSMILYEIKSSYGFRDFNFNFVVIGKQRDKWVKYISHQSLENMGILMNDKLHAVRSEVSNGQYLVRFSVAKPLMHFDSLMDAAIVSPSQGIARRQFDIMPEVSFTVDWDANANWVSIRHVAE